jgi:photosystem II stability/assembly factor-like uncharacterized protein
MMPRSLAETNQDAPPQRPPNQELSFLFGVSFTDAKNGTAVGTGGTILRTTDGGITWTRVILPGR